VSLLEQLCFCKLLLCKFLLSFCRNNSVQNRGAPFNLAPVEINRNICKDFLISETVRNGICCALFLSMDPPIPLTNIYPDASRVNQSQSLSLKTVMHYRWDYSH